MKKGLSLLVLLALLPLGCKRVELESMLVSADPAVRSQAYQKFSKISARGKENLAVRLLPYLKHKDQQVINRAVEALKRSGPVILSPLLQALKDDDPFVRILVADVIGSYGPQAKSAVDSLIRALSDQHPLVQEEALLALGKIGPEAKKALPAIKPFLKSKSKDLREVAKDAIKGIRP